MSSTKSVAQPKKRRRLNNEEDPQPGPSNAVLPLVAPELVRKSSRDPNRGMYPRTRSTSSQESSGFVSAARLAERQTRSAESPPKLSDSNATDAKSSIIKTVTLKKSSGVECIELSDEEDIICSPQKMLTVSGLKHGGGVSLNCAKQRRSRAIAAAESSHKITKYFKTSANTQKLELEREKCISHLQKYPPSIDSVKNPAPAEWTQKDTELEKSLASTEKFYRTFGDCYGLLEANNDDIENYFDLLPTHIIELILCQIPVMDLMSCRLVCSRWKDIIDDEQFMRWKKLYHKYKNESATTLDTEVKESLRKLIFSYGHKSVEDCISTLIKYMGTGFPRRPAPDMYDLLSSNPQGQIADQVMSERFPEWEEKEPRVWCQFAISLLICETVWEVFGIYRALCGRISNCSVIDITDAMYCVATFLLFYRNEDSINYGLHYRVYYALYLIENNIPQYQREKLKIVKGLPGQQSIHSYRSTENVNAHLTYEQVRVLNHKFELNHKIRIIALAGTGKTTTLLHLARLYPQIKFLNLVFNKAVSDDAKKKFPPNVTCQTAHSLAYASTGRFLRHKLVTKVRPYEIISHLKHNEGKVQVYAYANLVLSTINAFISSVAIQISLNLVPHRDYSDKRVSDFNRENAMKDARLLWEKMINQDDPSVKITHDVYLKLYQLKRPKLHKFQCIMVDEAQDCNPAMLDIILSQTVPVVLVGDPNQQIYSFRGCTNALSSVTYTHTYYLTKSFRFGPEIAYVASCLLECFKKNSRNHSIVGNIHDSFISGKVEGQYAVIARTNVKLFNEAVRMIVFKEFKRNEPTNISATFAGGIGGYGFDQMIDIYRLRGDSSGRGERAISDKFVAKFKSFGDLYNYAKHAEDTDLLSKIELVNQHGSEILKYICLLKAKCNHPIELANVVFSTAHKAKGLEFDTVYLTDDFPFAPDRSEYGHSLNLEDANVLYVALTRAKKCLILSERIVKLLLVAHEKFEHVRSSKAVLGSKKELECTQCNVAFTPHTCLLMVKQKVILGSDRTISAGPLCMKCGSDPHMRPEVHVQQIVMLLDPTDDNTHNFMNSISGPLPNDPPIIYPSINDILDDAAPVFVINVNFPRPR